MLVIDPEECIDCSLCEPECPVTAIYAEDDLPEDQREFFDLNTELSPDLAGNFFDHRSPAGCSGVGRSKR